MLNQNRVSQEDFKDITIALRYLPAAEFLEDQMGKEDTLIEIGSGSFGICPYLKTEREVVGVDVGFGDKVHPWLKKIETKGSSLPFKDGTFDFVLSMDVLEHIPPLEREKTLEEMVRVAKKGLVLGFPAGIFANRTDRFLNWYYFKTHHEKLNFLTEHLQHELPNLTQVVAVLEDKLAKKGRKFQVIIRNNTNIILYLGLLLFGFSQNKYLCRLYRYSLHLIPLFQFINFSPSYRKIIFVKILE